MKVGLGQVRGGRGTGAEKQDTKRRSRGQRHGARAGKRRRRRRRWMSRRGGGGRGG